ncbi:MAG TPA: SurA N-terminal domain-containing protein [Bacillota bacterium]|nr:SurA N-terminal domain-containing protein [Bacillota bacterium]
MRKILLFTALLSLTFLFACGDSKEDEAGEQTFEITDEEKVGQDEVVMYLNGEEVTGDKYNLAYLQTKVQLFQFEQDVSDQEVLKDLALDVLLEQELLHQEAAEKGIEVTEEDVEEELSLIKSESRETFDAFLDTYSFDEDSYKMMLSNAMLYDKYITEQFPNIEITDEEIEEAYEEIKSENEDVADLEEIEESLRGGLAKQKESEKMQELIESLKEEAEIETKI